MSTLGKWALYISIGIAIVVAGLYGYVKIKVGAVNMPLPNDDLVVSDILSDLKVPEGFSIDVYASDVSSARLLRFTKAGDLLVAIPNEDKIELLVRDENQDGQHDGKRTLIKDLNGPNGMDFYEGWLYIAETDAIGRVSFDHASGKLTGDYERIVTGLPGGENHWKKTLRFGADGLMYVTMGSSCNVCIEEDERRATMVRYQPDGSGEEIFAWGLRNSAGFDWSPATGELFATDNGRDLLGDDFPVCELNLVKQGEHYGWPFANGDKLSDPDFGPGNEAIIEKSIAPVFDFRAHNAPLGIEFVRGTAFPEKYRSSALVALHGSWNRSAKDGYKVVSLHWQDDGSITSEDFVTGFLKDDTATGRPAELTEGPDGAFYIADDYAGVIYRVAYGEAQKSARVSIAAKTFSADKTLASLTDVEFSEAKQLGETLYNQYQCVSCHRDDGRGLKKLEKLGEKYDLSTIAAYLRRPTAPMPIFPLDESQRRALGVYLIDRYPGAELTQ